MATKKAKTSAPIKPIQLHPDRLVYRCEPHRIVGCGECIQKWEAEAKAMYDELYRYASQLEIYVRGLVPVVPVVNFIPVR